jgi:hypothetical protein
MNAKQLLGYALAVIGIIAAGFSLALFIIYLDQMLSSKNFTSLFFNIIFSIIGVVAGSTLSVIGMLLIQKIGLYIKETAA